MRVSQAPFSSPWPSSSPSLILWAPLLNPTLLLPWVRFQPLISRCCPWLTLHCRCWLGLWLGETHAWESVTILHGEERSSQPLFVVSAQKPAGDSHGSASGGSRATYPGGAGDMAVLNLSPQEDSFLPTMQSGGPLYAADGALQLTASSFVCACALCIWNIYYSKLPSAHFTIITTSVCLVISTVTNKNAIIIPVISKMDVVVRSCRLWACSQKESCALQPCLLHLSCRGTLLFSVGLDLRGQRGNGDYVKKNWCEGVLVGV